MLHFVGVETGETDPPASPEEGLRSKAAGVSAAPQGPSYD